MGHFSIAMLSEGTSTVPKCYHESESTIADSNHSYVEDFGCLSRFMNSDQPNAGAMACEPGQDYVRIKLPVSPLITVCILMSTAAWPWMAMDGHCHLGWTVGDDKPSKSSNMAFLR